MSNMTPISTMCIQHSKSYLMYELTLIGNVYVGGTFYSFNNINFLFVATLALGSRPRQGFARVNGKTWARECARMWKWTLTLPKELPLWELESRWTPKTSKSDCKGQNPPPWRVIYIIGKLLKFRCPKWACMTHLDIFNISYCQKKGRESNWQFNSRPWKVGNRPYSFACRQSATCRWKALNEGYNFDSDLISIRSLHKKI
jgi:hypothetical protein